MKYIEEVNIVAVWLLLGHGRWMIASGQTRLSQTGNNIPQDQNRDKAPLELTDAPGIW